MTGDFAMIYELLADDANTTGGGGGVAVGVIMLIVGAVFYFLPTIIAATRKVRNVGSVVIVNLFLGWTLVGWVVALAMAVRTVDRGNEFGH